MAYRHATSKFMNLQSWNSSSSIEFESYFYSFFASLRTFVDWPIFLVPRSDLFNIWELPCPSASECGVMG